MQKLIVLGPGQWGVDYPLVASLTRIGRADDNDLVLGGASVSSRHATIEVQAGATVLQDLDSTNGTLVNGRRVMRHVLGDQDQIAIGEYELCFTESSRIERVADDHLVQRLTVQGPDGEDHSLRPVLTNGPNWEELYDTVQVLEGVRRVIEELPDPHENLHAVLELLQGLIVFEHSYIMLIDPVSQRYLVKASKGLGWEHDRAKDFTYSHTAADTAVKERRPVLFEDAAHDQRLQRADSVVQYGITSVLCVPIMHRDCVLGVIYLDNRTLNRRFTDDDRRFLEELAGVFGAQLGGSLSALERKPRPPSPDSDTIAL